MERRTAINESDTSVLNGCFIIFFILVLLVFPGYACYSAERITSFHSDISIHDDGSVTVKETIGVASNNCLIQYGICRDLQTAYRDRYLLSHMTDCQVIECTLDSIPESYQFYKMRYGSRIYIGSEYKPLTPGKHVYRLVYRLSNPLRKLGSREGFQWPFYGYQHSYFREDPWKRTGTSAPKPGYGYALSVDKLSLRVTFPNGVKSSCTLSVLEGKTSVQIPDTTPGVPFNREWISDSRLSPDKAIYLITSWPGRHTDDTILGDNLQHTIQDNMGFVITLAGLALLLSYYLILHILSIRTNGDSNNISVTEPSCNIFPVTTRYQSSRKLYQRYDVAAQLIFFVTFIASTTNVIIDSALVGILLFLMFAGIGGILIAINTRNLIRSLRNYRTRNSMNIRIYRNISGILFMLFCSGVAITVDLMYLLPKSFSPLFILPITGMYIINLFIGSSSSRIKNFK